MLRMLSDFLTESVFAKGLSVSHILSSERGWLDLLTLVMCNRFQEKSVKPMLFSGAFSFQSYLNTFAFKNTVYTNLWDHLQQVSTCTFTPFVHMQYVRSLIRSFPTGRREHGGFEYSPHNPRHHEPLDPPNGLPRGHN